jgi:hypothetical protein
VHKKEQVRDTVKEGAWREDGFALPDTLTVSSDSQCPFRYTTPNRPPKLASILQTVVEDAPWKQRGPDRFLLPGAIAQQWRANQSKDEQEG